jgi:hypothetical protein
MRAIHTIIRTLALAAVLLPLASCVEKEVQLPALSQPGNISYEADFGSLSLTWAPVDNAAQYLYKLENALGYTVTKGTTKNTYVTIGSLQPATTYTVRIKAIPAGVDANTYAASDFYVTEATTAAPKSYDFEWSYPATIWWYYDTDVYRETKGKTTFGYDKTLKAYVIQAWAGVMGMDIVFTLSDSGEWLINYAESTAYTGGPDSNMAVGLAHGIGGTSAANCWFYTNNTGSSLELSSTGGRGYAWMFNPDGNWTGYCVEFGEYTPDPPAPFVPVADAEESWSKQATATFDGEELGTATVTFDAETGLYTVEDWYGVAGHGIAFTRDAETGNWIMVPERSSAYIDGPYEGTGLYELSHGLIGKGMASTLLLDPSDSGYEGDGKNGELWTRVTDPSGKTAYYSLTWVTDMTPFKWTCDIYVGGNYLAQGTIAYDAESGEYTIDSWHGVPGYGIVFTLENGEWKIDYEKSTAYLSGPDGNTALGLAHGIEGAALANCWFYENNTGSWVSGDSSAGNAGCWMYCYDGNWAEYRVEWKEGSWSADAVISEWGGEVPDYTELGTATISYDIETGQYTISNWLGAEGYSIVFTLVDGAWLLDWEHSNAAQGEPDANQAVSLLHGRTDGKQANCWYWMNGNYSWFEGGPVAGNTGCWLRDHNNAWTEYRITW